MNPLIQFKKASVIVLGAFVLAWFGLSPGAKAVVPAPDGGYPNGNTAEGDLALFSLTTGTFNTALGNGALFSNTGGLQNTAVGAGALEKNTANNNTASGAGALLNNTTGTQNTATGLGALFSNDVGSNNTAVGFEALASNTTGIENTAVGFEALLMNTTISGQIGNDNTATGFQALKSNTTGKFNTANGVDALSSNTTGNTNTAFGTQALFQCTGSSNTALGDSAGFQLTTGNDNIDIGNEGVAAEANTIRIGTQGTQTKTFIAGIAPNVLAGGPFTVGITLDGQLGVLGPSSARFKTEIKPMDKASEAILALKPVTFRYKKELDLKGIPQFGLVAEDVEKVNPDLVVRDKEGKPFGVRYDQVNAMLLNEFLKEHRRVEQLTKDFHVTIAQQQKEIADLTATVKEQKALIQKVSAQLELSKTAPQTVVNNQ
jgi:hypothetical protein